jgi:predicted NBD/HSP70 family sugar kinase
MHVIDAPARGQSLPGTALQLIHAGQAGTRAELTSALGVTRATAGAVTAELQSLRLITVDTAPGAGGALGRPSHRLAIDPGGPVMLAAQLHPDGFAVALAELGGRIVARRTGRARYSGNPERAIGEIAASGAELARTSGRRCAGAALAVPSSVSEPDGTAVNPLYLDWPSGTPVRDLLAAGLRRAGLPVACAAANDINLAALAEHRYGAGRGSRYLLMVSTGHRGVGSALVTGGELYGGSSGVGMEAGHLSVDPRGRACRCGNRGCLDAETDHLALIEASGRRPAGDLPAQAAALLNDEYPADPAVREAAARLTRRLGLGLSGLINVLNPDRVVLGGLHRQLLLAEPARLRAAVARHSLWGRGRDIPLLPAEVASGSLIGAAELAWGPVLADPALLAAG